MASRRSAFHGGSPDSSPRPRFGTLSENHFFLLLLYLSLSLSNSNQISDFLSLHTLSGVLDLQISHRETASEEKGTLKTNTPKSNFIQQNGQKVLVKP